MACTLDVNDMLKDEITKINNSLLPPGFEGNMRSIRLMQNSISKLINHMGQNSATEQGLTKIITSAEKLRTADNQVIYIMKDADADNGKGEAVGILKVGRKHLFLFDEAEGAVRKVEPLCVLDFYVVRDRQRRGYGKQLFEHMLQDMKVALHELAIDGPSEALEKFLGRHYGVQRLLRQGNNFAVMPDFFAAVATVSTNSSAANTPSSASAVGRYSAPKPHSSIGMVIHGDGYLNTRGKKLQSASCPAATRAAPGSPAPSPRPPASPSPPASPAPAPEAGEPQRGARPPTLFVIASSPAPQAAAPPSPSPAGAPSSLDAQFTDKGFFDVKFYHKKLW